MDGRICNFQGSYWFGKLFRWCNNCKLIIIIIIINNFAYFLCFIWNWKSALYLVKNIINPIAKSGNKDKQQPLSCRGISIACTMYKLYTSILNDRIVKWTSKIVGLVEEEMGIAKTSTFDLVYTRKNVSYLPFVLFSIFKKSKFDSDIRNVLWKS